MSQEEKQKMCKDTWDIVDKLRGAIDAWEFKDYVFGFLFYKYISEDFIDYVNNKHRQDLGLPENFKYQDEKDDSEWISKIKDTLIQKKGYFIYPKDLFVNVQKKSNDGAQGIQDLNEDIGDAFTRIEESTQTSEFKENFEGLFKLIDLSASELGREIIQKNRTIKTIIDGVAQINFKFEGKSILGEIYEYLMEKYVSGAGRIGGDFYTPTEVSQLVAKLTLVNKKESDIETVYDFACGTGSTMLKFANYNKSIKYYGQEVNFTTYNLCRINMFMRGIKSSKFHIALGDTLEEDKFINQKFDVVVSSPPFGGKWGGFDGLKIDDPRFEGPGAWAPKNSADFAFVMQGLYHIKDDGVATLICFPGILFRDKKDEIQIRKWLIKNRHIDAVIQLTDSLLFGKSVAACILILRKNKTDDNIFFINAKECFSKIQGKTKLAPGDIDRIHQAYLNKSEEEGFSRMVSLDEIIQNEYSLSVGTYVVQKEEEEVIDIEAINKSTRELSERIYEINKAIDKIIQEI